MIHIRELERTRLRRWNSFQGKVFLALSEEAGVPLLDGVERYAEPLREHFASEFFEPDEEVDEQAESEPTPYPSQRPMSFALPTELHPVNSPL